MNNWFEAISNIYLQKQIIKYVWKMFGSHERNIIVGIHEIDSWN